MFIDCVEFCKALADDTRQQILVLHGHQADFERDAQLGLSRFVVRHLWRRLQGLGVGHSRDWMALDADWSRRSALPR